MDGTSTIIFIIASFCLGAILIMKRDSLPEKARKPLALTAIALIAFSFFLIVYSFFKIGAA